MDVVDMGELGDLGIDVVRHAPDLVRLRLTGELDGATAPRFAAELTGLLETAGRVVVALDLAGVSFCAVAGITVLLQARDTAADGGHALVLERLSGAARRVVHICGLETVLVEEGGSL